MDYLVPLLGGLAGSPHCVGMCGAIPLALGRPLAVAPSAACAGCPSRGNGARQLLYNLGRLNALVFLGALSGAFGSAIVGLGPERLLEGCLAIVAGGAMIVLGLEMLGLLGRVSARAAALVQATIGRALRELIASPTLLSPFAVGIFNAFLPCHLIYAFAAQAAATASPVAGAATMLAFGLGTMPAMLSVGFLRSVLSPARRLRLARASALLVLAFGALTIARGVSALGESHDPAHAAWLAGAHAHSAETAPHGP